MSAHDTPEVGSGETVGERYRCDSICDAASGGSCFTPWCRCSCHKARREAVPPPASPDPVQPAGAGEGLSILAAREAAWAEKYAAAVGERESTASRWCTEHDEAAAECWPEHTTPAAAPEAKCEGLAPFCCNNPDCPVHGDRIDPAELDAARLVGDMAEAEVAELQTRAESAEAALATVLREKAEDRARVEAVEALADEWDATPEPPSEDYEGTYDGHVAFGEWLATTCNARDLRAALAIPTPAHRHAPGIWCDDCPDADEKREATR